MEWKTKPFSETQALAHDRERCRRLVESSSQRPDMTPSEVKGPKQGNDQIGLVKFMNK